MKIEVRPLAEIKPNEENPGSDTAAVDLEVALADLVGLATRWPPQGSKHTTPDGLMQRPIQDVAILAANSLCRIREWLRMGASTNEPLSKRWCHHEGKIVHSCWVVLSRRAGELVALCERLRICGCTEAFARQDPFHVALAVKYQLHGGIDYED